MSRKIMYGGWIPGNPWHRRKWRQLGIRGRMRYSLDPFIAPDGSLGAFEYCDATPEVMKRLLDERLLPNPGSWTAYFVDTDVNLPRSRQLWHGAPVQL